MNGLFVNGVMTVVHEGKTHTCNSDHPNYERCKEAFKSRDAQAFVDACDIPLAVQKYSGSKLVVENDRVLYNGQELHNCVVDRLLNLMNDGFDVSYLVRFIERLMANPSRRSVEQLYNFLELYFLPITEDGTFLAYKVVRNDYMDKYSGKFDNSVGQIIECDRNEVCDDPDKGCSHGFHAGSLEYSGPNGYYFSPGDRIMIVEIDPACVVSVPRDVSYQKIRTCKYKVVAEYTHTMKSQVYTAKNNTYAPAFKEGSTYNFEYDGEQRTATVVKVFPTYLHCRCRKGDKSAGQFRNFTLSNIR